jgi:type III secretion system FlhB-like substrate exporter
MTRSVTIDQVAAQTAVVRFATVPSKGGVPRINANGVAEVLDYLIARADEDGVVLVERPAFLGQMLGLEPRRAAQNALDLLVKAGVISIPGDRVLLTMVGAYQFAPKYLLKTAKAKATA